jgi:mono/diheme cytochrome c family protein
VPQWTTNKVDNPQPSFKRRNGLVLATFTTLTALAVATAGCNELFPKRSAGEHLFRKHCAECHGIDAAGNTPNYMGNVWADLRDSDWKAGGDPESLASSISSGVFGNMPGFSDRLTPEEIRSIVDHLRVLRGEKLPEPIP